jgi:hypothetical protein
MLITPNVGVWLGHPKLWIFLKHHGSLINPDILTLCSSQMTMGVLLDSHNLINQDASDLSFHQSNLAIL